MAHPKIKTPSPANRHRVGFSYQDTHASQFIVTLCDEELITKIHFQQSMNDHYEQYCNRRKFEYGLGDPGSKTKMGAQPSLPTRTELIKLLDSQEEQ